MYDFIQYLSTRNIKSVQRSSTMFASVRYLYVNVGNVKYYQKSAKCVYLVKMLKYL